MTHVLKHKGTADGMTNAEIEENSQVFIIAGAETSASYLTGLLYHLLRNKSKLDKLTKEIRSTFSTEDDINMASLPRLEYLAAVIQEGMRIFPPGKLPCSCPLHLALTLVTAPQGVQRVTPKKGAMIAGKYVPGSILVGINRKILTQVFHLRKTDIKFQSGQPITPQPTLEILMTLSPSAGWAKSSIKTIAKNATSHSQLDHVTALVKLWPWRKSN